MSLLLDAKVFDAAIQELTEQSKKRIYQRDFAAWLSDVLNERMYEKMARISEDVLYGALPSTLIKSANGTSKTHSAARWVLWWVTAFSKDESLAILSAPTLRQVELGTWAYLKERYSYVKTTAMDAGKPMPWPGWISEQGEWKYETPGGNQTLAVAAVPGAQDAVSKFQGLRKTGGRNFVVLDEAGGVSADIFTAIDALMTSGDSRMVGIGNPDRRGTEFHRAFSDPRYADEYQLHTISAYELPTMTGEKVYPRGSTQEKLMLRGLTSAEWIATHERIWMSGGELYEDDTLLDRNGKPLIRRRGGKPEARFKAKVLGQFPDADDHGFFNEDDINFAMANTIEPQGEPIKIGFDVATTGTDESVVMINQGGRCRIFDKQIPYMDGAEQRMTTGTWGREDEVTAARRVHAIATYLGADEVRIDASGIGASVAAMLMRLSEFSDKCYKVVLVKGANSSANSLRWQVARDENHDQLRELLRDRKLDLDDSDRVLYDQLVTVTYELNTKGAIKITPKKDMRSDMHGSPDRLDALIYATLDSGPLLNGGVGGLMAGDQVSLNPWDLLDIHRHSPGMPI